MTKLPLAAGLALALVAGSALAADLPSYKAPPPPPPPPPFTWTGLYGGVNVGYGFGAGDYETGAYIYPGFPNGGAWSGSQNITGALGGGQLGFNYQFSPWLVVGLEADIQAADLNGQRSYLGPGFGPPVNLTAVNSAKSVDWFGTVRGRLGFVLPSWPNSMVYGTGGFAYGGLDHSVSVANFFPTAAAASNGRSLFSDTATGWTAGGGVEWTPLMFSAWSFKLEYLYTDLGRLNQTVFGPNFFGAAFAVPFFGEHTTSTRWHTIRAGVNWHFNPFATAPVLASY